MRLALSSRTPSTFLWTSTLVAVCLLATAAAQQSAPAKPDPAPADKATATIEQKSAKPAVPDSQQKLAAEAARLLKLATELNAEVEKTSKDTLSLKVVRQAEVIEKLAKGVKQELKQATGPS